MPILFLLYRQINLAEYIILDLMTGFLNSGGPQKLYRGFIRIEIVPSISRYSKSCPKCSMRPTKLHFNKSPYDSVVGVVWTTLGLKIA